MWIQDNVSIPARLSHSMRERFRSLVTIGINGRMLKLINIGREGMVRRRIKQLGFQRTRRRAEMEAAVRLHRQTSNDRNSSTFRAISTKRLLLRDEVITADDLREFF